jgi:hypothetical protein
MESKIIERSKLSMLMACASPGSALAFHLGLVSNGADLMRRTIGVDRQPEHAGSGSAVSRMAPATAALAHSVVSLLSGLIAGVERWSDKRLQAERERYLAQAQNISDVEARMRDLHSGRYWLP